MSLRSRLSRITLILATTAGLAASAGTASANPSDDGASATAPTTRPAARRPSVDDNRPAGAGQGRKVG